MYLRGLQMRKHLMNENNLLKPFYSPDEISVRSLSNQACINSAYAYLNGLYNQDYAGLENI